MGVSFSNREGDEVSLVTPTKRHGYALDAFARRTFDSLAHRKILYVITITDAKILRLNQRQKIFIIVRDLYDVMDSF